MREEIVFSLSTTTETTKKQQWHGMQSPDISSSWQIYTRL